MPPRVTSMSDVYHNPFFSIRADGPSSGTSTPAPPALSPSAIVGLAIIGAIFLTVLLAAMLRLCYRPSPQDANPSSLFHPDTSNTAQLERMKQVRDFNREAAWERARECHVETESEMEERVHLSYTEDRGGGGGGGGAGRSKGKERRMPYAVGAQRGSFDWSAGPTAMGVERGRRRNPDHDWRARMAVSAMEADGEVEMPERLDLGNGPMRRGAHERLGRESVLLPPPPVVGSRVDREGIAVAVAYEEDYGGSGSGFMGKAIETGENGGVERSGEMMAGKRHTMA